MIIHEKAMNKNNGKTDRTQIKGTKKPDMIYRAIC